MLSGFTKSKIEKDPRIIDDFCDYLEMINPRPTTSELSNYVDNAYINGNIICTDEASTRSELYQLLNNEYGYDLESIDDLDDMNIDWIDGGEVYCVVWE